MHKFWMDPVLSLTWERWIFCFVFNDFGGGGGPMVVGVLGGGGGALPRRGLGVKNPAGKGGDF